MSSYHFQFYQMLLNEAVFHDNPCFCLFNQKTKLLPQNINIIGTYQRVGIAITVR